MNDAYPVKIEYDDEDDVYVAEFIDLPGCFAPGASVEEAYQRAQQAKIEWIRVAKEQGLPIPLPSTSGEFSGRILLRMPSALHASLAVRAKSQATSLNQYAVHLLSGGVVGDSVANQVDQLKARIDTLESQLGKMSRQIDNTYSEIARQLSGALTPTPFSKTERIGGAYAAIGSTTGTRVSIH